MVHASNGQLPAYEWAFGDVNPPVHAWAAWRVYKIEKRMRGKADREFLESVFHKLLLNFTWWVNRKDAEGMNVFKADFSDWTTSSVRSFRTVADRRPSGAIGRHELDGNVLPEYARDCVGTGARESSLRKRRSKFLEHFVHIAHAMNDRGGEGVELWDKQDGFYYDVLHLPNGNATT